MPHPATHNIKMAIAFMWENIINHTQMRTSLLLTHLSVYYQCQFLKPKNDIFDETIQSSSLEGNTLLFLEGTSVRPQTYT